MKNKAHCLGPVSNVFWINEMKRFQTVVIPMGVGKIFSRGAKSGEICFLPLKIAKKIFLLIISKSRRPWLFPEK